jgi:hypothetical protein
MNSYSPGWNIAKHLRWNPELTSLAEEYLMRLFHVSRKEDMPPVSYFLVVIKIYVEYHMQIRSSFLFTSGVWILPAGAATFQ